MRRLVPVFILLLLLTGCIRYTPYPKDHPTVNNKWYPNSINSSIDTDDCETVTAGRELLNNLIAVKSAEDAQ